LLLISAGKGRDIRIKDHSILIRFPFPVHLHKSVIVLTTISNGCSRSRRIGFVIRTRQAIPIRGHGCVVTFYVDAFSGYYVMSELGPRKIVAEPDGCQDIYDVIVA